MILKYTHRGKRVVKVSIIFSYWVIPVEELSPDTFDAASQHTILRLLNIVVATKIRNTTTIKETDNIIPSQTNTYHGD